MSYKQLKLIGKGEFGDVFLCQRVETDQTAVVKIIEEDTLTPEEIKNIQKRIGEVKDFTHPNVVTIHGYLELNRSLHIFMDFMPYEDLRHMIEDHFLSNSTFEDSLIWKFLFQLLSGLNFLHEKGIIHCDLKPTNILLKKKQHYMISDTYMRDVITAKVNQDNLSHETLAYLAPEILLQKEFDRKCDIWSLGVILFEMVNLQLPFDTTRQKEFINRVTTGAHEPFKRHVSAEIIQLIKLMLKPERSPRPDCNELLRSDVMKFTSPAQRTPRVTDLSELIWNNDIQQYGDAVALDDFENTRIAAFVCRDGAPAKIFVLNKRMTYWVPMRQKHKLNIYWNSCIVGLEKDGVDGAIAVDSFNRTAHINFNLHKEDKHFSSWIKMDGPLQERWSVVGIRREQKVFFIGGMCEGKKSTVECFDTESLEWVSVLNLPRAAWRPAVLKMSSGAIMVIGGITRNRTALTCAQILSKEGHWYIWENFLQIPEDHYPKDSCIISACELRGNIYIFLPDAIYELEHGSTQKKMKWNRYNCCPPRYSDSAVPWGDTVVMTHKNQSFIVDPRLRRVATLPPFPIQEKVLVRASLARIRVWPRNVDVEPQTHQPPPSKKDVDA